MATIASNSLSPFPGSTAPTNATSAGASTDSAAPKDSSSTFMHLVNGMIQGNTPGEQLPSNLAAFLMTGEGQALEGLELDTSDLDD